MAQGSFSAAVSEWVRETKARQEAVFKESAQRVVEVMQTPVSQGGNLPVATGFLRASLTAILGAGLPIARDNPVDGGSFSYTGEQINLVIASADIGDTITIAYAANYAVHVEYGARGRPARRFVALAAQQWPRIVEEVTLEAKARAGG
jgi:hypothetical protein